MRDTRLLTVSGEEPPVGTGDVVESADYEGSVSDPLVQVYAQVVQARRTGVSLSASVKVPLIEAGYFGTGEWDVGVAASLSRFVGSATMLGLDVSYWRLGDTPDLELQDGVSGTISVGQAFGRAWTGSISLSGGRSAITGYADRWWAGILVGRSFPAGIWGLTASVGLTDGAPDFTVGLVWRARLGWRP